MIKETLIFLTALVIMKCKVALTPLSQTNPNISWGVYWRFYGTVEHIALEACVLKKRYHFQNVILPRQLIVLASLPVVGILVNESVC